MALSNLFLPSELFHLLMNSGGKTGDINQPKAEMSVEAIFGETGHSANVFFKLKKFF